MGSVLSCTKICCKQRYEKNEEKSNVFDIIGLPPQLREKIWRCLDGHSKKAVREVCSLFKKEIDLGSGLSVRLDDRSAANLKFVHSIEARRVAVVGMKKKPSVMKIFRCPLNVEFLETRCPLNMTIFDNLVLPLSHHLVSLSLMTVSLMSKSLFHHHQHHGAMEGDKQSRSQTNVAQHIFPCLLALQIEYGCLTSYSMNEVVVVDDDMSSSSSLEVIKENLKMFNSNMVNILLKFNCPRLTCFVIHPAPTILKAMSNDPGLWPSSEIEWENGLLKSFVCAHRQSLKLLDLFLYARDIESDKTLNDLDDETTVYETVDHLTDFILVVPFVTTARSDFNMVQSYWKQVVMDSSRLERLILQVEFWHNYGQFFKILPNILDKNRDTLTLVRLESFALDDDVYNDPFDYRRNSLGFGLTLSLFGQCPRLRTLEIYQLNPKKHFVATDLIHLPQSLKRLEVKRILIPTEELAMLTLPNLNRLALLEVGASGFFGINYKVMKKLWKNPSLDHMEVSCLNFSSGGGKRMEHFLRKSQTSDRTHPFDPHDHHKPIIILRQQVDKIL